MDFKKALLEQIYSSLQKQEREIKVEIDSVQEEMSQETKSSAGDKFETSREMMSQEKSRLEERLTTNHHKKRSINEMMEAKAEQTVNFGSLVACDKALFLFGLSHGEIKLKGETIMAVSLNSPIGKAFQRKNINETVSFMNKQYTIQSIS